jgi:ABC-type branched-subunit amino acid transport system ATPase component
MLEIRGLSKHFLGVPALHDVSFTVERGEIAGLIGPNGSGKTTLFDCVTGFLTPDDGQVVFMDQDITSLAPHRIARSGLTRIFQQIRTFPRLTVMENMRAAGQQHQGLHLTAGLFSTRKIRDLDRALDNQAIELLQILGIPGVAGLAAGTLSYGQQKLLEIAMALMPRPSLVLLDEPVAGVNPTLIESIKGYLKRLNELGTTFLIIEHNLQVVMDLCHRVIVLDSGELIAQGPPSVVQENEQVLEAYFGK